MPRVLSTNQFGDALEERVRDYFQAEIDADRFWARKASCKVFWKKGYHSKDRNAKIVFDVSIELYLPGSKEYSALVLIECKNYNHSVPVNDIEEFFAKVQQVAAANAKAVLASTASFQAGTREFAKSKGVGLLRYFNPHDFKWELKRSPSATARSTSPEDSYLVDQGLSQQDFRSLAFDLYLQSPTRETNSLWDFVEDLILDSGLLPGEVRRIANPRSKLSNQVPFLEKEDLESRSADLLSELGYTSGEVKVEKLCTREAKRAGLLVRTSGAPPADRTEIPSLGRITFDPLVIEVYAQEIPNPGRDRFTLAHELAHHLLSHGQYLVREYCDDDDFVLHRRSLVDGSDIARMEFQANYLAASILMPRMHFLEDFQRLVRSLELADRGFGPLYVDEQPCNRQNFEIVSGQLMRKYGVSRTATKIRLEAMGLLRDARRQSAAHSALRVFVESMDR